VHELGIAQALVEQVERVRLAHDGRPVMAVGVRIGSWRLVVKESLEFYYEAITRGTALEGSRLEVETVEATARCRHCAQEFPVEAPVLVCPRCGHPGAELLTGEELDLVSVELED
jgi:hydrogenase nickel incorporation protein HypA/HybF